MLHKHATPLYSEFYVRELKKFFYDLSVRLDVPKPSRFFPSTPVELVVYIISFVN